MRYYFSLLALSAIILFSASNYALAIEPATIAVVNMQKLIDNSTAAKAIKEQATKERDQYQASIAKKEETLHKEEAKLIEQRQTLGKEAFEQKRKSLNEKYTSMQREFQEKRITHDTNLKKTLEKINGVIYEIIDSLSKEQGFNMAMPSSQVLYFGKQFDITDQVLERLNQKLPTMAMEKSAPNNADNNIQEKEKPKQTKNSDKSNKTTKNVKPSQKPKN